MILLFVFSENVNKQSWQYFHCDKECAPILFIHILQFSCIVIKAGGAHNTKYRRTPSISLYLRFASRTLCRRRCRFSHGFLFVSGANVRVFRSRALAILTYGRFTLCTNALFPDFAQDTTAVDHGTLSDFFRELHSQCELLLYDAL